ncbi:hypothetical protein MOSE0_M12310 [Monosporozyma servazzii]
MVDADLVERAKQKIFNDFEDEHSETRVVMGTKLLSNGLDCKSVQFICLVDCSIDCVDYLQMVGRIRHWGFVKCLAVQGKRVFPPDTEIGKRFPTINWRHCVSESVARFYDVPFEGHSGCCGFKKRDDRIEDLKKNLKKGAIQILNMVGGNKDVIVIEDREDANVIPLDLLTQKVHRVLRVSGSDVLKKEWIQILGEYEWEPTKTLLANIDPVGTFKKYFNLIWKKHINVMLLIFNGDIDHCAESFSKMSEYYSNVFNNSRNIQKIAKNNGTAIFAIYKRHAMADLEAWYVSKITTTADKSLLTEFIGNMNYIPIAVIMIWAVFESRKYRGDFIDTLLPIIVNIQTLSLFSLNICALQWFIVK